MIISDRVKRKIVILFLCVAFSPLSANELSNLILKADSLHQQKSEIALSTMMACLKHFEEASPNEKLRVLALLSNHYLKNEMLDSAFIYCEQRLSIALNNEKHDDVISAKTDLGEIYGKKGEYQKAFEYLSEARHLGHRTQNLKGQGKILCNQAYLYYLFEKKEDSIDLLKQALRLYEQMNDTLNMAYVNNNLGIMHKNQSRYDSALVYLKQSYMQSMILKDTLGMASACNNMGNTLSLFGDLNGAARFLEKSLFYYESIGREEISLLGNIGRVYSEMRHFDKSEKYFKRALELAHQKGEPQKILSLMKDFSDFYWEQEDWKMALHYLSEYHQLKEQEYQKELPELIDRIQAEADLKVKEQTIKLLTEKNNYQALYIQIRNVVIVLLILFVIAGIWLAYSIYDRKQADSKRREIYMEQRLLRSQMNPHFFFNTLSIIQSFVVRNEAKLAGKYIAKFARLMREILENSAQNKITLQNELSAMENYLALQQLRMNNDFEYHISIDHAINTLKVEVPPMLFQPFIENAIDHGLNHLTDKKGRLDIVLMIEDDFLIVTIRDNGIGRSKAGEINQSLHKGHQSMGSKITEERLKLLANSTNKQSFLVIRDLKDQCGKAVGTEVELKISKV